MFVKADGIQNKACCPDIYSLVHGEILPCNQHLWCPLHGDAVLGQLVLQHSPLFDGPVLVRAVYCSGARPKVTQLHHINLHYKKVLQFDVC